MNILKYRAIKDNILIRMQHHAEARTDRVIASVLGPDGKQVDLIAGRFQNVDVTDTVFARVIAAGPGAYQDVIKHDGIAPIVGSSLFVPMDPDIRAGALVVVDQANAGERVYDDSGEEYRVIRHENVIGICE